MHKVKADKLAVKKQYFNQMKFEEMKNRESFNNARQA